MNVTKPSHIYPNNLTDGFWESLFITKLDFAMIALPHEYLLPFLMSRFHLKVSPAKISFVYMASRSRDDFVLARGIASL